MITNPYQSPAAETIDDKSGAARASLASSLAFGVLLGWFAVRLYRREAILG
jgi:hypothetical protein